MTAPPVQAILDAVIFDNGQFAGPDNGQYFIILSGQVDGERSLAQDILAGRISDEPSLPLVATPASRKSAPQPSDQA